jgi:CopG family transcriptional regulator/antitoxin EndoAI
MVMTISTSTQGTRRRILNVSVPPEMYAEIETIAQVENRTKSDLIREAFRHYQFTRRWQLIRQWGTETALRFNLETDEELEAFLES